MVNILIILLFMTEQMTLKLLEKSNKKHGKAVHLPRNQTPPHDMHWNPCSLPIKETTEHIKNDTSRPKFSLNDKSITYFT